MGTDVCGDFKGVFIDGGDEPSIAYRSGGFVFEEGIRSGRLVALSYSASASLMATNPLPTPSYMNIERFSRPQSFELSADGQSLITGWTLEDARAEGGVCELTLRSALKPIKVKVITIADGTGALDRRLEITNEGDRPCAIGGVCPLSGGVAIADEAGARFRLGYMRADEWGREGDFHTCELPDELFTVAGRYRRDRHRHPMFTLENLAGGETLICQFGCSGGYAFEFDSRPSGGGARRVLSLRVLMDSPEPAIVLAPGETYETPRAHFGMAFGGLDEAVNLMHRHLRESVLCKPARGKHAYIFAGIGPEYDMSRESTLAAIDAAAEVGAEVVFIDAGWYTPPKRETDWFKLAGDWRFNADRYPRGIAEMRERAHAKGLLFGMWMDAERVGEGSRVYAEHPEWVLKRYNGTPGGSLPLDAGLPEALEWIEEQITRLIVEYGVDMFRLDWNAPAGHLLGAREKDGFLENSYARYQSAICSLYARLREKYPHVIFENCAGGGGRTDVGMVANFDHTWVTDWQIAPRSFLITNGMSIALPPERINRLMGGQTGYLKGDLRFQMRNLMFSQMTVGLTYPLAAGPNPAAFEFIKRSLALYKSFIRPIMAEGDIYHHTPEPDEYGALELASRDGSRGVVGVFRLKAGVEAITVFPRGLSASGEYLVRFDNSGDEVILSGWELKNAGLRVPLSGALTSELITYTRP